MDDEDNYDDLEEDFYAVLNVSRSASEKELTQAYHRLGLLYHPDKHGFNGEKKEMAEKLFAKVKKAYDVLSDPHKRAIYDSVGVKGLETEGWEMVQRTKTPQEIREEYELLEKEREERRLQRLTNPTSSFEVGIDATNVFQSPDEEEDIRRNEWLSNLVEVSSMSMSQSIEFPFTRQYTGSLTGAIESKNGNGAGSLTASLRRIVSSSGWMELQSKVGNVNSVTIRGFRRISARSHFNVSGSAYFTSAGIIPGVSAAITSQLDQRVSGQLMWRTDVTSLMRCSLAYNQERYTCALKLQLGVPNTYAAVDVGFKLSQDVKALASIKGGSFGLLLEYGLEQKVSKYSTIGAMMMLGWPSGVLLNLRVLRASQMYSFPIHLSEEILPSAVFYGTLIPVACYYVAKVLLISPFLKEQKEKELEKKKQKLKEQIETRKREAMAARELMTETVERCLQKEGEMGLIIVKAQYGKLATEPGQRPDPEKCIDVIVPLQALVKDHKLVVLSEGSKSNLQGFYDPCIGEEKNLYIRYRTNGVLHEATYADTEVVKIPMRGHRIEAK